MPTDVIMPRLSDSMEEGTILAWLKGVGDEVAVGDELVEIETDKANMVFEADTAGTLLDIVAGEGETVPLGGVIATIGSAREPAAVGTQRMPATVRQGPDSKATPAPDVHGPASGSNGARGDGAGRR